MNDTGESARTTGPALAAPEAIEAFIARWQDTGGKERANYQLFLTELCRLFDLPGPDPATDDPERDAYVFERRVDIAHSDGKETRGYIDLYRRGHFVLEAKRVGQAPETSRWDKAMLRAAAQADTYIRALSAKEGRPPFLLTCDVGKTIEVYAEFTRSGGTYVPFPDPRTHRIHLEDLRDADIQQRLVWIWTEPDRLDPARTAARVTRELSKTLAKLARALEADGYKVERVAHFIKRCLFTMFCEDVDLLPRGEQLAGPLRMTLLCEQACERPHRARVGPPREVTQRPVIDPPTRRAGFHQCEQRRQRIGLRQQFHTLDRVLNGPALSCARCLTAKHPEMIQGSRVAGFAKCAHCKQA